ncbi:MAG: peptide chain release factor 1 [Planctomycetes bacterium]|nr:peptide chain release factor 1 [Planctomycetota bacterium]
MLDKLRQLAQRFEDVEQRLQSQDAFAKPEVARQLLRERAQLVRIVEPYREFERMLRSRDEAVQLLKDGGDVELCELARAELPQLEHSIAQLGDKLGRLLVDDDPNAQRDAIMEIRGGVGGDEATLFAADLFRMYTRYAERHGFKVEVLSAAPSEVKGFKEVVFAVAGSGAFDRLHLESGGHRVQRVPDTEAQGRIHTSLATVAVLPDAEDVDVELRVEDIRFDTYRSGGPGGQSVNKTSSAVRLTHLPSGLVVQCQDEASQHKNRAKAMRVLRARLYELEETKRRTERDESRRAQVGSGDRSERIRTYNFPQNRVTDHRLKDNYTLDRVIDGDLDDLLDRLKRHEIDERLKGLART